MKKDFSSEDLEMLAHISKVEAPPFLFTRIREKIAQSEAFIYSPKIAHTLGFSLALIILLNLAVVINYRLNNPVKNDLLVNLHIQNDNNLYP